MNENILPNGIATAQFIEDSNRLDNEELMNKYNVSARTLRRWRQFIRQADEEIISTFPESPSPLCTDYLKLEYENFLVVGDVECPDHDVEILNMLVRMADKLSIRNLIIAGDFMSMDVFSNWPKDNEQSCSFSRDLELAEKILRVFSNTFETIDYITGNHERRLAKQMKGQGNVGYFLTRRILDLQYSSYSYCEVLSGGKEILVAHPESYSRTPLMVPLQLAAVHHKNILCAHTHRLASGYEPSGRYWVGETGHARSPERTMYKSMKMASNPAWNAGYCLVTSGNLHLIHRDSFSFWMNNVRL
jgi:hypothetical protein